jgi:hypothetical protein
MLFVFHHAALARVRDRANGLDSPLEVIMSQLSHVAVDHIQRGVLAARCRRLSSQALVEISVMVVALMIVAGALIPAIADSISSSRIERARHDASRIAATLAGFQRNHGHPLTSPDSTLQVPHVRDPWGHEFLVNTDILRQARPDAGSTEYAVFVISAGPNGILETPFLQPASRARAFGDDVLVRIQ